MSKNEIKNTQEKAENLHQQEWGSILAEETQLSRVQRKVAHWCCEGKYNLNGMKIAGKAEAL